MRRSPKRSSVRRAFTLVELIVVIVILAIAAAMVIPYVSTTESQAVSAARMVAADLQYAQSLSVTTQVNTTVSFDTVNKRYTLSNQSGTLNSPITGKQYVVSFPQTRGFERVLLLSPTFGSGATVTFDSTGAPDNAGSVTVQAGGNTYRLDVAAATGNVTVSRAGG